MNKENPKKNKKSFEYYICLLYTSDAARQGDGYNYNDCFRHVKKEISEADMAIGNLEVTLGGKPYSCLLYTSLCGTA